MSSFIHHKFHLCTSTSLLLSLFPFTTVKSFYPKKLWHGTQRFSTVIHYFFPPKKISLHLTWLTLSYLIILSSSSQSYFRTLAYTHINQTKWKIWLIDLFANGLISIVVISIIIIQSIFFTRSSLHQFCTTYKHYHHHDRSHIVDIPWKSLLMKMAVIVVQAYQATRHTANNITAIALICQNIRVKKLLSFAKQKGKSNKKSQWWRSKQKHRRRRRIWDDASGLADSDDDDGDDDNIDDIVMQL